MAQETDDAPGRFCKNCAHLQRITFARSGRANDPHDDYWFRCGLIEAPVERVLGPALERPGTRRPAQVVDMTWPRPIPHKVSLPFFGAPGRIVLRPQGSLYVASWQPDNLMHDEHRIGAMDLADARECPFRKLDFIETMFRQVGEILEQRRLAREAAIAKKQKDRTDAHADQRRSLPR